MEAISGRKTIQEIVVDHAIQPIQVSQRKRPPLRKLADHDHPELSVSRQSALMGLPRSTLYDRPTPVREPTLPITARIDALYLEDPCSGSRRAVDYLARDGIPISRDRVRNLMCRLTRASDLRSFQAPLAPGNDRPGSAPSSGA